MKRALSITHDLRMRAANRTDLERTMAIIDYDLGHYEAARNRLVAMRAKAGDLNEQALLSRLLANVELELGDAEGALASAESAIAFLKAEQSGEALAYALQAKARALALMGRSDEAIGISTTCNSGCRPLAVDRIRSKSCARSATARSSCRRPAVMRRH